MEIYLLRHGIAEAGRPGHDDSERALTEEGREKLRAVLKRARSAGVEPTLILASPYVRAIETAREAADVFGYHGEIEKTRALLPEASPHDAWDEIRERKSETAILLAGHEPMMSSMAAHLLASPAVMLDMKKGAMVRVDCDRMGVHPRGVLKWMLTPALCGG